MVSRTRSVRTRGAAILAIVALSSGCLPALGKRSGNAVTGFNSKPVSSKEAPASLIAADESRCLVSEKKFRDTEIGTSTWCFWSGDVAGGGGVSRVAGPKRAAGATAKPDLGASAPKGQAPRLRSTGSS